MKRTLFLLPCALALGAALWMLNWRLDNPPPTKADRNFARLIRGADEVEVATFSGRKHALLKANDLSALLQNVHLSDKPGLITQGYDSLYTLDFRKKGKSMVQLGVDFDAGTLYDNSVTNFHPLLENRSRRNLERAILDALTRPASLP